MSEYKNDKQFMHRYAVFVTGVSFIYIFAASFLEIPKENIRFIDTVLGFILGTIVATIVQYFYGTSRSSQLKDSHIIKMRSTLNAMDEKAGCEELMRRRENKL